ncbi:lipopolysaccharide biosynthesis protein [Verrucosispora sp. WMMD1129]|uniref:lipopolysaccharide biosynthesis protein n=1 Tax=Verrucosispora sp. WMMD1129 TaxID=3016093 RepID=UPI00249C5430|nr:lipopolysaccharide biosynthesis protein [Verrucosispora sp. WMMD1129]WFE43796.1 lipopolysaccharide biosynthesis protein [Verrucosispora sp. WMMD1129]
MTDATPNAWTGDGPTTASTSRSVTITDVVRVPLHRIRLVAAVALGGLLAAVGYVLVAPASVTASAVVAVRPVVTDAFTPSGAAADRAVNMNVESGIATGTEVVGKLAATFDSDQRTVRDALEVEVPAGGQILRFIYQAGDAERAVAGANLAAQSYLDIRRGMYEKQREEMLNSYDESIEKIVAQRNTVQRRINNARDAAAAEAAVAELGGINNQLTQLSSARTEIAAVDVNPGWVTRSAEQALATTAGSSSMLLAGGLLGGTVIGLVLAFLWESADRRIRSVADARDSTGLPLLGTVRRARLRGRAVDADIRYVAMAVAERVREPARVAVVTAREDATAITAGLAVALAVAGREVFVADDSGRLDRLRSTVLTDRGRLPAAIDPTRPAVPKPRTAPTDIDTDDGPTEVITRRPSPHPIGARASTDPEATLTLPRVAKTSSRTDNGRVSGDEQVVVGAGTVRFGTWRQGADQRLVLYNAPPAEADERGVAVARQGTAVVVVERDRTRQADLRRLAERLRAAGVNPLGFVLCRSGRS